MRHLEDPPSQFLCRQAAFPVLNRCLDSCSQNQGPFSHRLVAVQAHQTTECRGVPQDKPALISKSHRSAASPAWPVLLRLRLEWSPIGVAALKIVGITQGSGVNQFETVSGGSIRESTAVRYL